MVKLAAEAAIVPRQCGFTYSAVLRFLLNLKFPDLQAKLGLNHMLIKKLSEVKARLGLQKDYLTADYVTFMSAVSLLSSAMQIAGFADDELWHTVIKLVPFCNAHTVMVI